jgi:hypothetical protein
MTDEPKTHTLDAEELADFDAAWARREEKRARDSAKGDPETAAEYARCYDGDLRIFLHQLCEISAIVGLPYDGDFVMGAGQFYWGQGVILYAGPGQRSRLIASEQLTPGTLHALDEFCGRYKIRLQITTVTAEEPDTDRIVDIPNVNDGAGPNHRAYDAIAQWSAAGLRWEVYSDSSSGDVAFSFETPADADRAKAILATITGKETM